jgi:hypothetical protein
MRNESILSRLTAFMAIGSAGLLLLASHTMAADDLIDKMFKAADQAAQEQMDKMNKAGEEQSQQQQPSQPQRRQAPPPQPSPQQSQQPTSEPQAVSPGACCTPQATAAIAKQVGKYDVLGIKLGMPAKEASAALQARGMQLKPETIKYDVLPAPLTYGLYAVNQQLVRNSGVTPGAEKIYLTLTMPPNEPVVAKINRFIMFTKETAPAQQALIGDLVKKYGPVSFATPPAYLNAPGVQDLYWVDDAQGNRLNDQTNREGNESELLNQCRGKATFSSAAQEGSVTPAGGHEIQAEPIAVKTGLEQGYTALVGTYYGEQCATHNIIHARLYAAGSLGISAPGVVGALTVVIGNGPLHRSATEASHKYLMEAAKMREIKEKEGAQKNKPAL